MLGLLLVVHAFTSRVYCLSLIKDSIVTFDCFPVGFPGCGDPADQLALPGCSAWSHVLRRAQPRSFPCRDCGKEQVQHPRQKPLHLRYEKLQTQPRFLC